MEHVKNNDAVINPIQNSGFDPIFFVEVFSVEFIFLVFGKYYNVVFVKGGRTLMKNRKLPGSLSVLSVIHSFIGFLVFIFCVWVLLGSSCPSPGTNQPKGDGQVEIVVEPKTVGDVVSMGLVVDKIQVVWQESLSSEQKVITIRDRQTPVNFGGLQEKKLKLFAVYQIPDGYISQIRYVTEGGFVAFTDGHTEKVFVPSGAQTGEKLVTIDGPIQIVSSQRTRIKIEFDPAESLVCNKGTGCHLKPTLKGQVVEYVPLPPEEQFRPHEVDVEFKPGVTREQVDELNKKIGAIVIRGPFSVIPDDNSYTIKIPDDMKEEEAVAFYDSSPLVESANKVFILRTATIPDLTKTDPDYTKLNYLRTIQADKAWETTTGSKDVKIAVLDTGIDATQSDLKNNVDTASGYNFVANKQDASDDNGHGTKMAGIIGATQGDGGIVGINWRVTLIPIKVCDSQQACDTDIVKAGLKYAKEKGSHIVNLSMSYKFTNETQSFIDALKNGFKNSTSSSILYVISSGNVGEGQPALNIDNIPSTSYVHPAQVPITNKIVVAGVDDSTTPNPYELNFYGPTTVDIMAPATTYSTWIQGYYAISSGTSDSAAIISGVAGLVLAKNPSLRGKPIDLKSKILNNIDYFSSLCSYCSSCGRVNAYYSVNSKLRDFVESK